MDRIGEELNHAERMPNGKTSSAHAHEERNGSSTLPSAGVNHRVKMRNDVGMGLSKSPRSLNE